MRCEPTRGSPSAMPTFQKTSAFERISASIWASDVEGDDRAGEGVNIAALEQLADPGGICVSGKVAREVEKLLSASSRWALSKSRTSPSQSKPFR